MRKVLTRAKSSIEAGAELLFDYMHGADARNLLEVAVTAGVRPEGRLAKLHKSISHCTNKCTKQYYLPAKCEPKQGTCQRTAYSHMHRHSAQSDSVWN